MVCVVSVDSEKKINNQLLKFLCINYHACMATIMVNFSFTCRDVIYGIWFTVQATAGPGLAIATV